MAAHLLHLTSFILLISALVLTGSRTGALLGICGSLAAILLCTTGRSSRRWSVALVMLFLFVLVWSGSLLRERIGDLSADLASRLELYRQVVGMVGERPFTGYGAGTFAAAFPSVLQPPLSGELTWARAHNAYLELVAELGIGSLLVVGSFGGIIIAIARAASPPRPDPTARAALIIAGMAATHSALDFGLQIEANAFVFAAALAAGTSKQSRFPSAAPR